MNERPGLRDVLAVWVLLGLVAAEIFATYSRLPARHLYHVSGSGPGAGAGRALVFLNFPVALVGIAAAAMAADRLGTRAAAAFALGAVVLCAAVFWPGVVDQADLDARPVNAIAAAGVALAVALTIAAGRGTGLARLRGDRARVALGVLLVLVAIEWLAADLGFSVSDAPVLSSIFVAERLWAPLGDARLIPIVHMGHHHGMDGTLLAVIALALSRQLVAVRRPRLRVVLAAYLSLMLVYGLANVLNDFWLEQLHKRGWVSWTVPSVLQPAGTPAWGVILVVAASVTPLLLRDTPVGPARRRPWTRPAAALAASVAVALVVVGATETGGTARTPLIQTALPGEIAFPLADHGFDIYVMQADGRGLRSVADDDSRELAPAWSRDGRTLVFQSDRDGGDAVFADSERLARGGEPAPGANALAVVRHGDIWIGRSPLGRGEWPHWSPDGKRLAYDRGGDIWIYAAGRSRRLTSGPADDRFPAFSPGGKRIAYESDASGSFHVWVVDAIGSEPRQLTFGPADDFGPSWSPDERWIAFVSNRDGRDQLYVVGVDSRAVWRLTGSVADKDAPAWRPRP